MREELLARTGEESRLNATFMAFLSIACRLAAAAGTALVGVFISVTTVPAAGYASVAATVGLLLRR